MTVRAPDRQRLDLFGRLPVRPFPGALPRPARRFDDGRPHLGSHRDRVATVPPSAGDAPGPVHPLDAVLVPAYRSPAHLAAAAEVAAAAGCHLVLLCSGGVSAHAAIARFGGAGLGTGLRRARSPPCRPASTSTTRCGSSA
jgi:hypothetical protein